MCYFNLCKIFKEGSVIVFAELELILLKNDIFNLKIQENVLKTLHVGKKTENHKFNLNQQC